MEIVWESGATPPKTHCQRRKKKCIHGHSSASEHIEAERSISDSSPSPVRVGDYHPESILTDLSTAVGGEKAAQVLSPNYGTESSFQRGGFRLSHTAPTSSLEQRQTEWWNHHRFRQNVKPLSEHQQRYLEAAGAFLVLPKSTTDILIPTYVSVIDGLVPIVDGTQVLRDYNNGTASNYLVRAICLLTCKTEQAAPFLRLRDGDPVLGPLAFVEGLYDGLNVAIRAELEHDRITQIQILTLMHLCNDGLSGVQRASASLSQAIHESWFLSLHYNVAGNTTQNQCDMLWWSLRCFDRLNRIMVGVPFMISDNDIQISRPTPGSSYQSQVLITLIALGDLLIKVDEIYNPHVEDSVNCVANFPSFSEITANVNFHAFQSGHRSYLEIWYHVAAMLSCRSGSPESPPYERRLESADKVQELMSHGRHAHLPPLPLIPYAIAMALTVEYRALRENKRTFTESYPILRTRLEILEALGTRWTTAKVMAKLARRALRVLRLLDIKRSRKDFEGQRPERRNDPVHLQNRSEKRAKQRNTDASLSGSINTPLQNKNFNSESNADGHRALQLDGTTMVSTSDDADVSTLGSIGNLDGSVEGYEWPMDYLHFNQSAIASCDFPNFGMVDMFNDPMLWGVSPNVTECESLISGDPASHNT